MATELDADILTRIEREVLRNSHQLEDMVDSVGQLAKGLTVLAARVGEIHAACCGPQPPSELGLVLRELASAVTRTGDLVQTLVERLPPRPH